MMFSCSFLILGNTSVEIRTSSRRLMCSIRGIENWKNVLLSEDWSSVPRIRNSVLRFIIRMSAFHRILNRTGGITRGLFVVDFFPGATFHCRRRIKFNLAGIRFILRDVLASFGNRLRHGPSSRGRNFWSLLGRSGRENSSSL